MTRRTSTLLVALCLALAGCGAPAPARAALPAAGRPVAASAVGVGPLMFVGGGADQDDVMKAFGRLAGGAEAAIAIVPLASSDPPKSGAAYVTYLGQLGFGKAFTLIPHGEPDAAAQEAVAKAGGFFFSGGDQARILAGLTPGWREALGAAWRRGAAIGGTSAGSMVWGRTAIMGGEPMQTGWYGEDPAQPGIRLAAGLGLLPRLVVDTHFGERGRLPRVAYAVAKQGGGVGLGVDPQTAAVVRADGHVEVVGRGTVTVVRSGAQPATAPLSLRDMKLDILSDGDAAEVGALRDGG